MRALPLKIRASKSALLVSLLLLSVLWLTSGLWGSRGSPADSGEGAAVGPVETVPSTASAQAARIPCTVERIVDGDTLVCSDAGRVRLLLIDTPELDQGPFGEVAKLALEQLLPVGVKVELETDVQLRDSYDRLLAYLILPDGRMANEALLDMGVAVVAVYPPNVRHVDRFRGVVEVARAGRRGLWAIGAFECLPSDHRAGRC